MSNLSETSKDELVRRLNSLSSEYDKLLKPIMVNLIKIENIKNEMRPIIDELTKRGETNVSQL